MDDKRKAAAEGLFALSQIQRTRNADVFPEIEFEGKKLALSRVESAAGQSAEPWFHKPDTVKLSGAGGTKRVFDLGDGRALAMLNFDKGVTSVENADVWLDRWRKQVHMEAENSAILKALGFETQAYEIRTVKVGKGEIPVLVMPTFETLASQGKQVRDVKIRRVSAGDTMFFGNQENLESPEHIKALMGGLVDDCARIAAYGLHLSSDSYNFMVVGEAAKDAVAHDVVSRKQSLRMLVFDIADWPVLEGPKPSESLHAQSVRVVERMFDALLNGVSHQEVRAISKNGETEMTWDNAAMHAFSQVKDELVAKVEARARELHRDAAHTIANAKYAAEVPPKQLQGMGSPQLLTGRNQDVRRGAT